MFRERKKVARKRMVGYIGKGWRRQRKRGEKGNSQVFAYAGAKMSCSETYITSIT